MNELDKSYSDLKIFHHPQKLMDLKDKKITAPVYVRIKPTNKCNHRCFYCSYDFSAWETQVRSGVNKTDELSWDTLKRTLNQFGELGIKAVTYSGGGEPLVYPEINKAMNLTLKNGIDLSIITNGQLLNGESAKILSKAKWVRISLDSCNANLFEETRRISSNKFNELKQNIQDFVKIKDSICELGINCVVHHKNKDYILDMAKFAKDIGVDHIKFAARIIDDVMEYHKSFKDKVICDIEKAKEKFNDISFRVIDRYSDHFNGNTTFIRPYSKCYIMQIVPAIAANGGVYCCHDTAYVPNGLIGNLYDNTFKEIWFSENTKKFFNDFDAKKLCYHHCMYDSRNLLINQYLDLDNDHINFV